jgi:glycosyltransferase involved in cell wall biosynthesis
VRIAIDCRKIDDFGIGTYIRGLVRGLAASDADHQFVLLVPPSSGTELELDGRFTFLVDRSPLYSLRELASVGLASRRAKADVFHAPHYVVPVTGARVVVTIHDLIHLRSRTLGAAAKLYARVMIGRAVRRASRILTVSEAVRSEIESRYPTARGRTRVTPNGVDQGFILSERDDGEADTLLARMGLAKERYFLFAGNDKPHKNVDRLVAAYSRVRDRAGGELVLAGAPFDRHRSVPGVRLAGFVPLRELALLYRGATAVVVPSLHEGFGLPAAEAMRAGGVVATSHDGALVEVTGDAALHFEPTSVDSIAEALAALSGDPALRALLRQKGAERALRFDWQRLAEATLETYLEAAG